MNEFSCRVIIGMVEMAEAGGIPRERLLHGFRHSPEHIMNPRNRTDWETGMEVTRRARREAGSREAYLALGRNFGETPAYNYLHLFGAAFFDPIHLFMYPNQAFFKMTNGQHVHWTWRHVGPRELEVHVATDEAHPAAVEYWEINLVACSRLPGLIGMPDAEGELLDHSPLHATYRFRMPPSGTLWARARRFLFRENRPAPPDDAPVARPLPAPLPDVAGEARPPVAGTNDAEANEISCRIIIGLSEMAEASGIDRRRLLEGWRQSPASLLNPRNRTDWATLSGIVGRLREASPSREAFLNIAQLYGKTAAFGFFRRLAAATFSPAHFFTYPNAAVVRLAYGRTFRYEWKKLTARHLEFTYTLRDGLHGSRDFWEFQAATMAGLPCLIGLSQAIVETISCTLQAATSRATLPPSGTLWAKAARFLRMHGASPDPAFQLFAQQHEDLRHSYEKLNEAERERAELSRELLRVADSEREQFARDIHDGLGQELYALKLQIERLSRGSDDAATRDSAGRLAALVQETQRRSRDMARGYDPMVAAAGSFADAVRNLAKQFDAAFDLSDLRDVPLDAAGATHLYRIVQEAIANAVRHGGAARLRVAVAPAAAGWELTVEDDGSGFVEPGAASAGMGLRTMRYRAEQLGGRLRVEPRAGGGTRVACEFPASGQ